MPCSTVAGSAQVRAHADGGGGTAVADVAARLRGLARILASCLLLAAVVVGKRGGACPPRTTTEAAAAIGPGGPGRHGRRTLFRRIRTA
ncbi:hypothetical protein [Streptomonospora salina]|uniref:Uncharacterized protein n=1 Tax=Streptomonospora salina TaxID=104205 RepID=A0A841EJR6_9ACTN|nr:hypothetical protein [Streptomonospora salina]MBB6001263.1 hypothetical protein [Streptomonospora salina]